MTDYQLTHLTPLFLIYSVIWFDSECFQWVFTQWMCWQLFRDTIQCSHSPQSTYISPAVSVVAALCLTTSSAEASVFLQVLKSHYFLNWFINLYANVMVFQNRILNAGLMGFLFSFFYSVDQVEQVHKHCQKK